MKTRGLLLVLFVLTVGQLSAQTRLVFIQGGTVKMGGGFQFRYDGYGMRMLEPDPQFLAQHAAGPLIGELPQPDVPDRQVTISSFFLSPKEVTNAEYRAFLRDSLLKGNERGAFETALKTANKDDAKRKATWEGLYARATTQGLLPDTACWRTDFPYSFNRPMAENYFFHPAFDDYPVLGVTWDQAQAYCAWLSAHNNAMRAEKGLPPQPDFRLPSETEWEYAAMGGAPDDPEDATVGWRQPQQMSKGLVYTASIKTSEGNYIGDNYMYTSPSGEFPENPLGLYDMAGNAAEWTLDIFRPLRAPGAPEPEAGYSDIVRVVKGGSWADYWQATIPSSRCAVEGDKGSSRVGFRVAMTYVREF